MKEKQRMRKGMWNTNCGKDNMWGKDDNDNDEDEDEDEDKDEDK